MFLIILMLVLKKNINIIILDNKLSIKHIDIIIKKNNCITDKNIKKSNYKINNDIKKFIIKQIKINNTLIAKDFVKFIKDKFNIIISLTSIYSNQNNFLIL
jgi:hypothetical protein